jgi:hypothetical protein
MLNKTMNTWTAKSAPLARKMKEASNQQDIRLSGIHCRRQYAVIGGPQQVIQ